MKTFQCEAVIFDLDGVLVDSNAVIERQWRLWAERNRFDLAEVLKVSRGMRTEDAIRVLAPHLDAQAEAIRFESDEALDTDGLAAIPGAAGLLASLPEGAWAVATSGPRAIALPRLQHTGLPVPRVLVTAEEVSQGKPAPDVFLLAAERLGAAPSLCVVVEDAPAGVAAARAAGMKVIALVSHHTREALSAADARVASLLDVKARHASSQWAGAGGMSITLEVQAQG